ncbi:hypothetical protein C8Q74DRAFT_546952 [Fomes fomentarius]|nr:hypothetical protein C8Q74DRAFT_546952 [Fomes fomentarius]
MEAAIAATGILLSLFSLSRSGQIRHRHEMSLTVPPSLIDKPFCHYTQPTMMMAMQINSNGRAQLDIQTFQQKPTMISISSQ